MHHHHIPVIAAMRQVLGKFKLGGHIDPDLFDVFINEKVYLDYANKFLSPEQVDEVDLNSIPGVALDN